jgi:competence ComEA-like helix-hairpin-helix protein
MWGREMRAGVAFVIAALLLGQGFREWRRAHAESFQEIVRELTEHDSSSRPLRAVPEASAREPAASPSRRPREAPVGRIDVNRAGETELMRLPGIGAALAARIVAERERAGAYDSPQSLLRVPGIGPKTLARIQAYLSFPAAAGGDSLNGF